MLATHHDCAAGMKNGPCPQKGTPDRRGSTLVPGQVAVCACPLVVAANGANRVSLRPVGVR